jgi:hypothetical protein
MDKDVAKWSGMPFYTMLIASLPMLVYAIATGERPGDASKPGLAAMLLLPVVLGTLGWYRGALYLWSEHKRIQELGATEDRGRSNRL